MSAERQKSIQQDIESIFFDWMMSKRVERKTTTHVTKRKMYEDIVQKLLASVEVERGLFAFLGQDVLPAFNGDFDLPMIQSEVKEPTLCAFPFENFSVTGVIPFSRPIQLHWVPYSNQKFLNCLKRSLKVNLIGAISCMLARPSFVHDARFCRRADVTIR